MNKEIIDFSQISLYNTQRVSDEQSRLLFVARTKLLNILLNSISGTTKNAPPKHQLIVGQRGMGKTTLLKRLEVELRLNPEFKSFLPLLFPEEQYNLDSLTTFWLNCIDAIADILEKEGQTELVTEIDKEVKRLSALPHEEREKRVSMYFKHIVFNLSRRPVLLIDNINIVFGRLNTKEQHILRSYLTEEGAAIIIGASSSQIDDINTYAAPFYDAFQVHYLKKLSSHELIDILNNLAIITGHHELKKSIRKNGSRLKAINQLTGGNPRTAVILFKQIINGFSEDITQELEGILDAQTPLYKARFEELPEKMQIIVNSIAIQWDPVTLEQIRNNTQMDNGQISPQLKRLIDFGWIERPESARGKGGTYEISERMFNIWFLMRLSSRRQKKMVSCLSKFMEAFYEKGNEITEFLDQVMLTQFTDERHALTALALAKLTEDKKKRWELHEKSRQYIITHPESSDCFDIKDLFDGADEHATAINNAIKNNDAQSIVYYTTPLYNAGLKDCAPILAQALIIIHSFSKAKDVILNIQQKDIRYNLLIDLIVSIHDFDPSLYFIIEECCLEAIKIGNIDSDVYFYYAKFLMENRRLDEALSLLNKADNIFPNDPQIYSATGEVYYCLGDNSKAEKYFTSPLLNNKEDLYDLNFYLGTIRYDQERFSEAEKLLTKVINEKDDIYANIWLIPTLLMLGKTEESLSHLMKTVNMVESPDDLSEIIFQTLFHAKQYEKLTEYENIILEHWPNNSILHYYLAESLFFQEDYTEANKHLETYLAENKDDGDALFLRSMIAWQADNNAELAISYIKQSIDKEETDGKYYLLGLFERDMSDYKSAFDSLNKSILLNTQNTSCILALSEICEYKLNQMERAQHLAEDAYHISKNSKLTSYRLVNLYRDGVLDPIKAEEILKKVPANNKSIEWEKIHQILTSIHDNKLSKAEIELRSYFEERTTDDKDYVCYLYAKCIELGVGTYLLTIMEEAGMKETSAPEYYAVEAIISGNPIQFFDTVAKEVREIGLSISKKIEFYIRN